MRIALALLATVLCTPAPPLAQQPESEAGLVGRHQAWLDAITDGVVLNVAAHPDDESSRTNTILRRRHGLRVVTAYTTYGDGGQNAIGREIGPELAQLRVRETLAAAAMMDVEVRWLGMTDFGYSKTLEETLQVWGADVLRDAMRRVVDEVDPDVVLTNHNLRQGHGHHRASFWAIQEVLRERAQRGRRVVPLYYRCSREEAQVTFDPAELDAVRGETYARLAHRAWVQHVTQGPWSPHDPLQVGKDHWRCVFPEQVPDDRAAQLLSWLRPSPAATRLAALREGGAAGTAPLWQAAREGLVELAGGDEARPDALRRRLAIQRILLADAGVRVESWLERNEVARGGEGTVFVVVHGMSEVEDLAVSCRGRPAVPVQPRVRSSPFDAMPAQPAGAAADPGPGTSDGPPGAGPGRTPAAPAPVPIPGRLAVTFTHQGNGDSIATPEPAWVDVDVAFTLRSVPIRLRPRHHYTPVDPIELRFDRDALLVPKGQTVERIVSASVTSWRDGELSAPIRLAMGPGIRAEAIPGRIALSREHPEARLLLRATFAADELASDPLLRLELAGQQATLQVVPVEVFVPPGLRVGLVRGPDDTIERALADLGVAHVALERDALATTRLEQFTTLLLDMRAYHHRPELAEVRDRILQFCRAGGRVVAMYHKPGEWNERAGRPLLAPFALTVGNDRITEEDSPVVLLLPEHRLFQHPHVIDERDFGGWVQERGLNFPDRWDPAWTPLLQLKDSGDEKPHQGALLYTQYGRGDFVYCSLVLYRQLRHGHAGAARLLINLLAR